MVCVDRASTGSPSAQRRRFRRALAQKQQQKIILERAAEIRRCGVDIKVFNELVLLYSTSYNSLRRYFSTPYDLLRDGRIKFIFSVVLPFVILLFLWFLGPFGLAVFPEAVRLKLVVLEWLGGTAIFAVHLYVLQKIFVKTYTIGTTILWLAWIHVVIGVDNLIVYSIVASENAHLGLVTIETSTLWIILPSMIFQTLLVGLLPTFCVVVYYNAFRLKKKIAIVNQINSGLREPGGTIPQRRALSLFASNLREVITVDANALTYITSVENYVDVHWLEDGLDKHALLRNTLSNLEKSVSREYDFIKRCHHGYIVNLHRVTSLSGNEAGYKLHLEGSEVAIPVSRKYKKNVIRSLQR